MDPIVGLDQRSIVCLISVFHLLNRDILAIFILGISHGIAPRNRVPTGSLSERWTQTFGSLFDKIDFFNIVFIYSKLRLGLGLLAQLVRALS